MRWTHEPGRGLPLTKGDEYGAHLPAQVSGYQRDANANPGREQLVAIAR